MGKCKLVNGPCGNPAFAMESCCCYDCEHYKACYDMIDSPCDARKEDCKNYNEEVE